MTDVEVTEVGRILARAEDATAASVDEALASVRSERQALSRLAEQLAARIDELDQLEQALADGGRDRAPSDEPSGDGPAVSDLVAEVLADSSRALSFDRLADECAERFGIVDRRRLTGALNGGSRGGRFLRTPGGRWKLGQ